MTRIDLSRCQCDILAPKTDPFGKPNYSAHEPGQCEGLGGLAVHIRNGKHITLCYDCNLTSDIRVSPRES